MWSCAAFFSAGYFPSRMSKEPVASMVLAAVLIIPFGMRSKSIRQGLFRGIALGLIAGIAALSGLAPKTPMTPQALSHLAMVCIGGTVAMSAAVSALFAHLAKQRRRRIEDEWK